MLDLIKALFMRIDEPNIPSWTKIISISYEQDSKRIESYTWKQPTKANRIVSRFRDDVKSCLYNNLKNTSFLYADLLITQLHDVEADKDPHMSILIHIFYLMSLSLPTFIRLFSSDLLRFIWYTPLILRNDHIDSYYLTINIFQVVKTVQSSLHTLWPHVSLNKLMMMMMKQVEYALGRASY